MNYLWSSMAVKASDLTDPMFLRFQNRIVWTPLKLLCDSRIRQYEKSHANRTCSISIRQHETKPTAPWDLVIVCNKFIWRGKLICVKFVYNYLKCSSFHHIKKFYLPIRHFNFHIQFLWSFSFQKIYNLVEFT